MTITRRRIAALILAVIASAMGAFAVASGSAEFTSSAQALPKS